MSVYVCVGLFEWTNEWDRQTKTRGKKEKGQESLIHSKHSGDGCVYVLVGVCVVQ